MNQKNIFCIVLLLVIASLDISLAHDLEQRPAYLSIRPDLADADSSLAVLRAFELPPEDYHTITSWEQQEQEENGAVLAYLFSHSLKKEELEKWCAREQAADQESYASYIQIVSRLLSDARYFPVAEAANDEKASVTYENSWQYERTYGGTRGHEGCDIMADIQKRGYYPIVSTSDGIVEKLGWLPKGGYRIGIRSPSGVYYYYAHLAEYEEGITEGMEVTAGQLIGYMGDTGYSEIEGTTGNFPVHLHFGMYLDDAEGNEVSYNTYYLLKLLEDKKLAYVYS